MIKRTHLKEYESRVSKIQACRLKEDDLVVRAELVDGKSDVLIVTVNGMSICFRGSEVNPMGRAAMGVRAIQLKKNDKVMSVSYTHLDVYKRQINIDLEE